MPTSANVSLPLVPPQRSHAQSQADNHADKRLRKDDAIQERSSGSEWIDVEDDKPARRKRRVKRNTATIDVKKSDKAQDKKTSGSDIGRFFPKLSQILETVEPKPQSRPRQETRTYSKNDTSIRRPMRRPSQPSQESLLQLNASLLSVISGLTTSTERSSGSNSTITQRSYSRRSDTSRRSHRHYRRSMSDTSSMISSATRPRISYEYSDVGDEEQSVISSSVSSRHHSEAGESEAPETPSSRSTYPSPGYSRNSDTRRGSTNDDAPLVEPSLLSSVDGSEDSIHTDGTYESSVDENQVLFFREPDNNAYEQTYPMLAPVPSYPSSFSAQQLEDMQRSRSQSSTTSDQHSQQALQHYYSHRAPQDTQEPLPLLREEQYEEDLDNRPPPAPEVPDVRMKTVAGYEKLALELASSSSKVRPIYRKFEFLNHRLLLHLQDELAELEEQLRAADEMIAQMEPKTNGKLAPVSRRGEAYYGADIHHQRTAMLGRIFMKTDQYNKAMSSYAAMVRDCAPAQAADIQNYRSWMQSETPVHEREARYLADAGDLVTPGVRPYTTSTEQMPMVALLCTALLALPPALFVVVPSIVYRHAIILSMVLVVVMLRTTTTAFSMLTTWNTTVCMAAFVPLMSLVAFCAPQQH